MLNIFGLGNGGKFCEVGTNGKDIEHKLIEINYNIFDDNNNSLKVLSGNNTVFYRYTLIFNNFSLITNGSSHSST